MAKNIETGEHAEQHATHYFSGKGYSILHRNWRFDRYEIDLITLRDGILHFVEVKARRKTDIAPEVNVTPKKFLSMKKAARAFLYQNPSYKKIQFDILSVTMNNEAPEFFLIEDVYL